MMILVRARWAQSERKNGPQGLPLVQTKQKWFWYDFSCFFGELFSVETFLYHRLILGCPPLVHNDQGGRRVRTQGRLLDPIHIFRIEIFKPVFLFGHRGFGFPGRRGGFTSLFTRFTTCRGGCW